MPFSLTSNDVRGPLRWWYAIGAPPNVPQDAPLRERERVRIGKVTSLALFIELIEMGIAGFSTREDPNKILAFGYLGIVLALLLALLLNRSRRTTFAGVLVVVMLEIAMGLTIFGVPHQQLTSFNLPLFELFIQPLLIAASLFPIWCVFPIALYHIAFIILSITFMAKTPDLVAHIRVMPYTAYGIPITVQVFATLISFIWVRSAYDELRRAETAQEVTRLTQQLAEQMMVAAGRREELERNIEVIRSALVGISNGNYQQRISLTQQDILWPIALSLNNLLNRVRGFREQSRHFEQIHMLLSELTSELRQSRTSMKPLQIPITNTGTEFDALTVELRAWLPISSHAESNLPPLPPIPPPPPPPQARRFSTQTFPQSPPPNVQFNLRKPRFQPDPYFEE
jgi:hypothetical protein